MIDLHLLHCCRSRCQSCQGMRRLLKVIMMRGTQLFQFETFWLGKDHRFVDQGDSSKPRCQKLLGPLAFTLLHRFLKKAAVFFLIFLNMYIYIYILWCNPKKLIISWFWSVSRWLDLHFYAALRSHSGRWSLSKCFLAMGTQDGCLGSIVTVQICQWRIDVLRYTKYISIPWYTKIYVLSILYATLSFFQSPLRIRCLA